MSKTASVIPQSSLKGDDLHPEAAKLQNRACFVRCPGFESRVGLLFQSRFTIILFLKRVNKVK
jgi:hypothetical protein